MARAVRLPESVAETAEDVQEEFNYQALGEAVRHMCREGGYDV